MKSGLFFILLLGYLQAAQGEFTLTVLLNEFNNGQGFLANGSHCNPFWFSGGKCSIQLKVGVDFSASGTDNICNNNLTTMVNLQNVTTNANRIVFGQQTYGSWANPNMFVMQNGSYDGFTLCVEAKEATTGALIDSFATNRISDQRIDDFTYYSDPRLNGTLEPTMIAFAWSVRGDTHFTQPTRPPTTTTTLPPLQLPIDCEDAYKRSGITTSGPINITLPGNKRAEVYCEIQGKTALTVIQSRGETSASKPFDTMEFADYQTNQGTPGPNNDFWLGLDNLNLLTTGRNEQYDLSIVACCGNKLIARQFYTMFSVSDAASGYKLNVTGTQTAGLLYGIKDTNMGFKTEDHWTGLPKPLCEIAKQSPAGHLGGWWFGACSNNLNGHYYKSTDDVWSDMNACTLDQSKPLVIANGPGIELNTVASSTVKLNWVSATRVRMAVYQANGEGVPPTTNFCN